MDPGFLYHGIMGEWYTEVLYSLTDSLILPFDLKPYGTLVMEAFQNFQSTIIQRPIAWLASGSGHDLLSEYTHTLDYCLIQYCLESTRTGKYFKFSNLQFPQLKADCFLHVQNMYNKNSYHSQRISFRATRILCL